VITPQANHPSRAVRLFATLSVSLLALLLLPLGLAIAAAVMAFEFSLAFFVAVFEGVGLAYKGPSFIHARTYTLSEWAAFYGNAVLSAVMGPAEAVCDGLD
jgi:hypothetical protein